MDPGNKIESCPGIIASNKNSDVVVEVSRNSELKVLKKSGKWYYVEFKSYKGWVEEDCITYINPKPSSDNNSKPSKLTLVKITKDKIEF